MVWKLLLQIAKNGQKYRGDLFGAFLAFLFSVLIALLTWEKPISDILKAPIFQIPLSMMIVVLIPIFLGFNTIFQRIEHSYLKYRFSNIRIQIFNGYVKDTKNETKTQLWYSEYDENDWKEKFKNYNCKLITSTKIDDEFSVLINPFGETYPEENEPNLQTLKNILKYVSGGGVFINVAGFPFFYSYNTSYLPSLRITGDIQSFFQLRNEEGQTFLIPASNPTYASLTESWVFKNLKLQCNLFGGGEKPVFPVEDSYFKDLVPSIGSILIKEFRSLIKSENPDIQIIPILKSYSDFPIKSEGKIFNTKYPCYPIAAVRYGIGYFVFIGVNLLKCRPEDFNLVFDAMQKIFDKLKKEGQI